MGNCLHSRRQRPAQVSPVKQRKDASPSPAQVVLIMKPKAPLTPEVIAEQLESQDKIEQENIQWLKEEEEHIEQKPIINHYRQILLIFQKCWYQYHEHDMDTSNDHVLELLSLKQKIKDQNQLTQAEFLAKIEAEYTTWQRESKQHKVEPYDEKLVNQIQIEHQDILHYDDQINRGEWIETSNSNGVKLSTRREGDTVGALIETEIDVPFEILISVLIEIELYTEFIPFNQVSTQEKIFSRNCRIGYNLNNYPFLSKRQAYFQGIGYSRIKKTEQFFLFTRSIHDRQDLQKHLDYKVNINTEFVQLCYKYFVVKYKPLRRNVGKLTIALNADMKLNFLPMFVLEFLIKDFAKNFLKSLVEISHDFKGSQWEKNVEKNPQLFLYFKHELQKYYKDKGLV